MSEAAAKMTDDRRECVLRAAERSFTASGFHGARMAQIAKEAQMSPGHIYHYFESKEQIIAEMIRAHFEEKLEMLARFENAGDEIVDMIIENLEDSVDTDKDPFWSILILEIAAEATRNDEIASSIRNMDAEVKARVLGYLRKGVDQEDLDTRFEIFVALLQGIRMRNIINPNLDKPAVVRIIREIVESLFRRKA